MILEGALKKEKMQTGGEDMRDLRRIRTSRPSKDKLLLFHLDIMTLIQLSNNS